MTISPNRRSTKRGRPLVTDGAFRCSRCQRMANQRRATWPGEQLCYSCFYAAMRTRGVCPQCGHDGVLPGRPCRRRDQAADLLVVRRDSRRLHLSRLRDRSRSLPARNLRPLRPSRGPDRVDDRRRPRPRRHGPDRRGAVPCRPARQHPDLERSPRVQELLTGLACGDDPVDPCRASTKPA